MQLCSKLIELAIVWNALKTSRKVLAADMPSATEAQQYEAKIEHVIMQGVAKLNSLQTIKGPEFRSSTANYVMEMVEKCQ